MSDKDEIEQLKARLAQPDGREVALAMMVKLGVRPELVEAFKISGLSPAAMLADMFDEVSKLTEPEPLKAGIYVHRLHSYLLIGLCRRHDTGEELVAYVPLRTDARWAGTARINLRTPEDFRANFEWVGERQPKPEHVHRAVNFDHYRQVEICECGAWTPPGVNGWTADPAPPIHVHSMVRKSQEEQKDICSCGAWQAWEDRGSPDQWVPAPRPK